LSELVQWSCRLAVINRDRDLVLFVSLTSFIDNDVPSTDRLKLGFWILTVGFVLVHRSLSDSYD